MVADVTGAGTIYYTPYLGNYIPLWDGDDFVPTQFAELSQLLTDTNYAPVATSGGRNYDLFVFVDTIGIVRLARGPAWTSDTVRGMGTGTTELVRVDGLMVNANNISFAGGSSLPAFQGVYVGSMRTDASNKLTMMFNPAPVALGTITLMFVWNMYNRVKVAANNPDATDSWTYTTASWRFRNGSGNCAIQYICGIAEDSILAISKAYSKNTTDSFNRLTGIGVDVASGPYTNANISRKVIEGANAAPTSTHESVLVKRSAIGYHYVAPIEIAAASGTATWYGDNGGSLIQCNIHFIFKM